MTRHRNPKICKSINKEPIKPGKTLCKFCSAKFDPGEIKGRGHLQCPKCGNFMKRI